MEAESFSIGATLSVVLQPAFIQSPWAILAEGLAFVLFLLLSAFFSGSEVALFSLERAHLEELKQRNDGVSKLVLRLLEQPRHLLVSILILNTLSNVAAAILAAMLTMQAAVAFDWSPTAVLLVEMVLLTFILLIVSEITPKMIAARDPVTVSRRIARPLRFFIGLIYPVAIALTELTTMLHRFIKPRKQALSPEDLKIMADMGHAHGSLEEEERELIYSIVEFGETTVKEVMVSRMDIVAIPTNATLSEAIRIIRESGHSRFPLYEDHLDNILGIVYAKDLLPYLTQPKPPERVDWRRIARPAMFVPMNMKLIDLLRQFQVRRTHIAIVVDEYGGTAGLVTLEDVLEEIVGEIRDEYDEREKPLYEKIDDYTYRFDARINLDDMAEILGIELDTEQFDFETLGGLIFHLVGDIPEVGTEVTYGPLRLRVESIQNHRIGNVLVRFIPPNEQPTHQAEQRHESRN